MQKLPEKMQQMQDLAGHMKKYQDAAANIAKIDTENTKRAFAVDSDLGELQGTMQKVEADLNEMMKPGGPSKSFLNPKPKASTNPFEARNLFDALAVRKMT